MATLMAGCAATTAPPGDPVSTPPTLDLGALWNFGDPAASEARFRDELARRDGDDAFILQTQIARTHGLRRDIDRSRGLLRSIEPQRDRAGAAAQVHWWLEWGRTWSSAVHDAASQTPEARAQARHAFERAIELARSHRLDGLHIDALHMMAFVDRAPADQLRWGREALAVVEASAQPAARRWEASIRNNVGVALHELGRFDEALVEFRRAVALREAAGNAASTRVAHWMVAWTLRAQGKLDEALAIQHRLEQENAAAGTPDRHVFAELAALYRARGDAARADAYLERERSAARP